MGALMSFAGKTMHRRLRDILPTLPIVFGLAEPEAAASIGISVSQIPRAGRRRSNAEAAPD